jgi:hypothetical protein
MFGKGEIMEEPNNEESEDGSSEEAESANKPWNKTYLAGQETF